MYRGASARSYRTALAQTLGLIRAASRCAPDRWRCTRRSSSKRCRCASSIFYADVRRG